MALRYINFDPELNPDGSVRLISTSKQSADGPTIELRDPSDSYRLHFDTQVVKNAKHPEDKVRGKLIYEKKGKNDPLFPSEESKPISKNDIRKGDTLEIELKSGEIRRLYEGLRKMYRLAGDVGGIPSGAATYVEVDSAARSLLGLLRESPSAARMLANKDTFDLVRELVRLLTQGTSHEQLSEILNGLESDNLASLSAGLSLEILQRAANEIRDNFSNTSEEYWQAEILEKYPWIISQLFSTPCTLFHSKTFVGGTSIEHHGGNVVDFIYQNELTKNLALVEIKKPSTSLLGGVYRNHCYSLSPHLSGAVNQVLSYRHSLMTKLAQLKMDSPGKEFEAFNPQCIVIIGSTSEFDGYGVDKRGDAVATFENFRNALNGVTVITFDELLKKVEDLISILSGDVQ